MNMLLIRGMDVAHEQYNVKHDGKHEILLLDTCLLYLYFTPDWVGQYLGNYHNKLTQIFSALYHGV